MICLWDIGVMYNDTMRTLAATVRIKKTLYTLSRMRVLVSWSSTRGIACQRCAIETLRVMLPPREIFNWVATRQIYWFD